MAAGLGVLHLSPTQFWAMTPRELALALRGLAGLPAAASLKPLGRSELGDLMQRFPDVLEKTP